MASNVDPTQHGIVPPPPGVTPNFDHPAYQSCGIVPVTVVFLTLATIFLILRLYTKARILKVVGAEDYIIIVAWVLNVISSAIVLVQQKYGNGEHIWEVSIAHYRMFAKASYRSISPLSFCSRLYPAPDPSQLTLHPTQWGAANVVIYIPAAGLAKVAILLFYLRINPDRTFRLSVFFVLFVTISYMVSLCFALIFECHPISGWYDPIDTPGAKCADREKLYLANSLLNVLTDFLVLALPVPMLVRLHVGVRQKLLIWSAFAAGSLTCIISAVRAYTISKLVHSLDPNWDVQLPTVLTTVETNLTIICSAIMLLRPLLRQHFPTLFSTAKSSGNKTPASSNKLGGSSGQQKKVQKGGSGGSAGSYTIFGDSLASSGVGKGSRRAMAEGYGLDSFEGEGRKGRMGSDVTAVEGGVGVGGGRSWFDAEGRGKSESEERIVDKV